MAEYELEPQFDAVFFASIARDYDAAARFSRALIASASDEGRIGEVVSMLNWLAWVEQARGGEVASVRDTLASLLAWDSEQPESQVGPQTRGRALVAIGREDEGWALIEQAVEERRSSQDQARLISNLWGLARTYAQFGRGEEALAVLEEAVGRPASQVWSMADLELEPRFDTIRDDPRFDDLLARQQAYEDEQARIAEAEGPWLP
jgi:serine/threonine-protein kinase